MKTIRNEADRANLIGRLNKLTSNETALWGKMNANQMLSHLVQAGEMPFAHNLPDASNFMSRTFIKPLVLYVVSMPKEVKTSPQMNQQENGRKPLAFEEDRKLLIESIEKLASLSLDYKCLSHPFFGKLNTKEWATLAYKHIDHHLKQFGV
jgi:Protein of unknown function (DUF1569)